MPKASNIVKALKLLNNAQGAIKVRSRLDKGQVRNRIDKAVGRAVRRAHRTIRKSKRTALSRKHSSRELAKRRAFPWADAVKKLHQMPSSSEVTETIWSSGTEHKCGSPCVAHCIAGQPRDFSNVPGLRKALKHRVFERFSPDPLVFAVFATSAYHHAPDGAPKGDERITHDGVEGFTRTIIEEMRNDSLAALVEGMEEIGVQRALLLNESCHDPSCMENPSLQCDANDLGLSSGFDERDGKLHHICDIQFKRFQTCMTLVRDYEQEHGMKFDWVTRNRPDVYWVKPIIPASELQNHVYVTPWNVAYGAIDWFFAMPRGDADVFSQFTEGATCSQLHHPKILPACATSLGCECWMASWLYQNNVNFAQLDVAPYTVAKFCGAGCPNDWDVSDVSIEGLEQNPSL